MMARYALIALVAMLLVLPGCGNLSPRDNLSPQIQQDLDNQKGRINGLENNQNAIKLELGRLSNELGIQDSQVKEMQQGWINIQAALNRNENSGIQILQGDGPLVGIFCLATLITLLYFFRRGEQYRKTAAMLGRQISMHNDGRLKHDVLAAAMNTDLEKQVYRLVR